MRGRGGEPGPFGQNRTVTTEISPFRIDVPQADLDDLRDRLARTRWPDQLPGVGWDYGIPLEYVRELAWYWRDEYDWRVHEARLNGFDQFVTTIDGARVHFLHVRSAAAGAMPLIITHGWPGSVVEFWDIIGPLTDPAAYGGSPSDAFHLVIPSIPGYGFSGPTRDRGWDARRVARAWAELMSRLGYQRYGAQGGDWGSVISRELGLAASGQVAGVHLNMLITRVPDDAGELTEEETSRREAARRFRTTGSGYSAIQGSPAADPGLRPDRLTGRAAGVDHREVRRVDRQRAAGRGGRPRSAAHQRHAVLADRDGWLLGAAVLRDRAGAGLESDGPLDGTHRCRRLPARDRAADPALRRAIRHHRALDRVRPRRPLRGHGGARPAGRRRARVLPGAALTRSASGGRPG